VKIVFVLNKPTTTNKMKTAELKPRLMFNASTGKEENVWVLTESEFEQAKKEHAIEFAVWLNNNTIKPQIRIIIESLYSDKYIKQQL